LVSGKVRQGLDSLKNLVWYGTVRFGKVWQGEARFGQFKKPGAVR